MIFATALAGIAADPAAGPTRLLRTPAVSATQIAFAYANNIWIVARDRETALRLTSFRGQTTNPHFSPDTIPSSNAPSRKRCGC
jgi:tricorn protease